MLTKAVKLGYIWRSPGRSEVGTKGGSLIELSLVADAGRKILVLNRIPVDGIIRFTASDICLHVIIAES